MTLNDVQRAQLVLFAAREVGPRGSVEQMRAICCCIRNRVRNGWGDGTWMWVLEHHHEVAAHAPSTEPLDPNNRPLQRLMRDVDEIFFGNPPEEAYAGADIEGAIGNKHLYWMFLDRPAPTPWFLENIVHRQQEHKSTATMGTMIFFQ